jgi:hypothetical protein
MQYFINDVHEALHYFIEDVTKKLDEMDGLPPGDDQLLDTVSKINSGDYGSSIAEVSKKKVKKKKQDAIEPEAKKGRFVYVKDHTKFFLALLIQRSGFTPIHFTHCLAEVLPYTPEQIAPILAVSDKFFYDKIHLIRMRAKGIAFKEWSVENIMGTETKVQEVEFNIDTGAEKKFLHTRKLSEQTRNLMMNFGAIEGDCALSKMDENYASVFLNIKCAKFAINPQLISEEMEKLYPCQIKRLSVLIDFLQNKDNETVFYKMIWQGGFQAGKTRLQRLAFAISLNEYVNSTERGDVALIGACLQAVHNNFISKFCETFKLTAPHTKSNIWKISQDVSVNIYTSKKESYHKVKGGTHALCFVDEQDAMNMEVAELLPTRWTKPFKNSHGLRKLVVLMTRNPDFANPVCKFMEQSCEVDYVSADENLSLPEGYRDDAVMRYGGEDSNSFKAYWHGLSVPINKDNSIFNIKESIFMNLITLIENDIDDYATGAKRSPYYEVGIGYDHGFASMAGFIVVGYRRVWCDIKLKHITYADVLMEKMWAKGHGTDMSSDEKMLDIKNILDFTIRISPQTTIYVPHDAPYYKQELLKFVEDRGYITVRVLPTFKRMTVEKAIDAMRSMFDHGHIAIDSGCKILKQQLYAYRYEENKLKGMTSTGTETDQIQKILKRDDHSVDALRYALCPYFQEILLG